MTRYTNSEPTATQFCSSIKKILSRRRMVPRRAADLRFFVTHGVGMITSAPPYIFGGNMATGWSRTIAAHLLLRPQTFPFRKTPKGDCTKVDYSSIRRKDIVQLPQGFLRFQNRVPVVAVKHSQVNTTSWYFGRADRASLLPKVLTCTSKCRHARRKSLRVFGR